LDGLGCTLALGLHADVIAKHVTTEHARTLLERYRADYGQGYHLRQPAPIAPGQMIPIGRARSG
jgi:EAL domain-containing protein (putative c-di-GMP-specific phosphodiesterase class I)